MITRRMIMANQHKTRLPDGYQEVTWIANTDNQWLDTGIIPNDYDGNWNFEITTKLNELPEAGRWLTGNAAANLYFLNSGNYVYLRLYVASSTRVASYYTREKEQFLSKFTVKCGLRDNGTSFIEYGGEQYYDEKADENTKSSNPLRIFRATSAESVPMTLYHFKATDLSGNLISELIPCYRTSDNEIGVYDIVRNIFLTNQGTGTFTKGPNP